jgi:hypothetical protein
MNQAHHRTKPFRIGFFLCAALLVLGASEAKANTYLFSFTAGQVLDALKTVRTNNNPDLPNDYYESAYFALFFQPDATQIANYSFVTNSLGTPNPSDPNVWETSIINDPSNPNLGYGLGACTSNCDWAGYYKNTTTGHSTVGHPSEYLDYASVVSDAALPGTNIFLNKSWRDLGSTPFYWGGTLHYVDEFDDDQFTVLYDQVINTVIPKSSTFSFTITTNQTLSGTYRIKGSASALISGSTTAFDSVKDDGGILFDLDVTANYVSAVPEPSTCWLMLAGSLVLGIRIRAATRKKQTHPSPANCSTSCGD